MEQVQRWTAPRKAKAVLEVLRAKATLEQVAGSHGLEAAELEKWQRIFIAGGEDAFKKKAEADEKAELIRRLKQKLGEFVVALDIGVPEENGRELR